MTDHFRVPNMMTHATTSTKCILFTQSDQQSEKKDIHLIFTFQKVRLKDYPYWLPIEFGFWLINQSNVNHRALGYFLSLQWCKTEKRWKVGFSKGLAFCPINDNQSSKIKIKSCSSVFCRSTDCFSSKPEEFVGGRAPSPSQYYSDYMCNRPIY